MHEPAALQSNQRLPNRSCAYPELLGQTVDLQFFSGLVRVVDDRLLDCLIDLVRIDFKTVFLPTTSPQVHHESVFLEVAGKSSFPEPADGFAGCVGLHSIMPFAEGIDIL